MHLLSLNLSLCMISVGTGVNTFISFWSVHYHLYKFIGLVNRMTSWRIYIGQYVRIRQIDEDHLIYLPWGWGRMSLWGQVLSIQASRVYNGVAKMPNPPILFPSSMRLSTSSSSPPRYPSSPVVSAGVWGGHKIRSRRACYSHLQVHTSRMNVSFMWFDVGKGHLLGWFHSYNLNICMYMMYMWTEYSLTIRPPQN